MCGLCTSIIRTPISKPLWITLLQVFSFAMHGSSGTPGTIECPFLPCRSVTSREWIRILSLTCFLQRAIVHSLESSCAEPLEMPNLLHTLFQNGDARPVFLLLLPHPS